ncbi:hypothetical protein GQ457_13G022640 [Hibiscus cannabinus]
MDLSVLCALALLASRCINSIPFIPSHKYFLFFFFYNSSQIFGSPIPRRLVRTLAAAEHAGAASLIPWGSFFFLPCSPDPLNRHQELGVVWFRLL